MGWYIQFCQMAQCWHCWTVRLELWHAELLVRGWCETTIQGASVTEDQRLGPIFLWQKSPQKACFVWKPRKIWGEPYGSDGSSVASLQAASVVAASPETPVQRADVQRWKLFIAVCCFHMLITEMSSETSYSETCFMLFYSCDWFCL